MFRKTRHVHFVGIGGVGMSGIAEVLINSGYKVSGSDLHDSKGIRHLCDIGAEVFIGHSPSNINGSEVVVVSSAVRSDNVEIISAKERSIPVIPRGEMLSELMRLKYGIAVAGSHGKTTTTSMIATVLAGGGLDPTMVIGGRLNSLGSGARLGQGNFLVAEADESDGSFLSLSPTIAVVTTIDREHLDYYRDIKNIKKAFIKFINRIPFYGVAVLCIDQEHIQNIIPEVEKRYITYGLSPEADYTAKDILFSGLHTTLSVYWKGRDLGKIGINMPGIHNVSNLLAAIVVGQELDIDFSTISNSLEGFSGIERRFHIKGEERGIIVMDDYGHHPAEIRVTLRAAKGVWKDKRIIVVFQPHRYTRVKSLLKDFFKAFHDADSLIVTSIYSAGERPIQGVDGHLLCNGIKKQGHRDVVFIEEKEEIVRHLLDRVKSGDVVMTLGAGDIWKVGVNLLRGLRGEDWKLD
ncbi:MAG: UDP-N-acetylmuramate--L-alanine ligase [Nitrospinae bacterium]|nr:UDP-N-acetylmuramate--L-alanine ligase [Nitrospinota bacterium]